MTPAELNLTIEQHATFSRAFQLKGPDGSPLDLSSHQVAAELWADGRTKKLATFTVVWDDRAEGKFKLFLPHTVTAALGVGGWWDLIIINPDETRDYWLRGRVTLSPGYTE